MQTVYYIKDYGKIAGIARGSTLSSSEKPEYIVDVVKDAGTEFSVERLGEAPTAQHYSRICRHFIPVENVLFTFTLGRRSKRKYAVKNN